MRQLIIAVLAASVLAVYSFPVDNLKQDAVKSDTASNKFLSMFKIGELIECYKKHGFDPTNLPGVKEMSAESRNIIFNSCNPLFNVPIIGLQNNNSSLNSDGPLKRHRDDEMIHSRKKRTNNKSPRSRQPLTPKATRMAKTPRSNPPAANPPQPHPYSPLEVHVVYDGVNVVSEILRLHFLFLNAFFSSLSGCIETEGKETSECLLDSFSSAFALLALELEENK